MWEIIAFLLLPTVAHIWKKADIAADPLGPNFKNGYYTNFVNPLGFAAVATPNGFARDGVPSGVTLVGPAHSEPMLAVMADRFSATRVERRGAR